MTPPPMAMFDTMLGRCGLSWTAAGISRVFLPGAEVARVEPVAPPAAMPPVASAAIARIRAMLAGSPDDLHDLPIDDSRIDPFRRSVYAATRRIPPGSTWTYGEIARVIGSPGMAREVGIALARNPCPIIVPCHRVIAASGALTGFSASGGIETKRRMLELEGAPGFGQQSLFV